MSPVRAAHGGGGSSSLGSRTPFRARELCGQDTRAQYGVVHLWRRLVIVTSFVRIAFARAFLFNHFGPWGRWNGGFRPEWLGPGFLHFIWLFVVLRAAMIFAAGWGLMERAPWGRIVAIVAAFLSLIKFPFGTALGIWTLVTLMGYRNQALYEQLP